MENAIEIQNWKALIKPSKLNIQNNEDKSVSTVIAEPLEKGYALTIGNSLRRILMSSVQGSAITAVQIDGVLHEFSSINGVREDVTDIVLNVKSLSIKNMSDGPKKLVLDVKGPGEIKAKDIQPNPDVKILNPDLVICNLDDNTNFHMELIANNGKKATAEWAKGVVANMARDSKGNDRAQILAVAAGEADLAVANTYYLALMLSGKKGAEQQAAAKKVKAFFPNQNGRGTHMNISGGGVLKYAPNKANAIALLEFLLTKEAQEHIVNNTFEYPMINGVEPHKLVVQMGLSFKQDLKTKVSSYGKKQADALEVMLAAKWK